MDIDDASGLAVVGAKHQVALDQYKETVGGDRNSGEKELERVGAVYVYSRANEFRDGVGTLIRPPRWASYEVARLQAVDYDARDLYGTAVAISNYVLFAGATGDDGKGINGGATYQSDIEFSKVAFRQKVFPYMENDVNKRAEVSVLRTGPTTDVLVVSYSTSDSSDRPPLCCWADCVPSESSRAAACSSNRSINLSKRRRVGAGNNPPAKSSAAAFPPKSSASWSRRRRELSGRRDV